MKQVGGFKYCSRCDTTKPVSEYWRDASKSDGLCQRCKKCQNELHRENVYPRKSKREDYKAAHRKRSSRYIALHPERARAHRLAGLHKAKIKKESCETCGSAESLHMHHPDYTKPLEVITLCVTCHEAVHHA